MTTTTTTTDTAADSTTPDVLTERYACTLRTAIQRAGAPGRVQCSRYPAASSDAQEGPHAPWPFVCTCAGTTCGCSACRPVKVSSSSSPMSAGCPDVCPPGVHPLASSAPPPSPSPTRSPDATQPRPHLALLPVIPLLTALAGNRGAETCTTPQRESTMTTTTPATLVAFDPADLRITANIRSAAQLDKTFLASIKELGVLVPIVACRDPDQALTVLYGHRRTVAAVEAGLATVPVMVIDSDASAAAAASVARIVGQWAEIEHRVELSGSDRVAALDQLAAFGISPAQIAKREVDAALSVARSGTARDALADAQLTIEQAAVFAEFDEDPDVVEHLRRYTGSAQFDHVVQQLRDRRDGEAQRHELAEALTSQGVSIIDRPDYRSTAVRLARLGEAGEGRASTPRATASAPGTRPTSTPPMSSSMQPPARKSTPTSLTTPERLATARMSWKTRRSTSPSGAAPTPPSAAIPCPTGSLTTIPQARERGMP